MAKRRGHGEGSIYLRSDGRWAGSVENRGGKGKRPRKTVYGRTRSEVQKKVDAARRAIEQGLPLPDDRLTVEQYLRWWITEHEPGRVDDRTLQSYEQKVDHLIRLLGRVRLWKLSATQVEAAYRQLLVEGHSAGGVRAVGRVLSIAMNQAVKKERVPRNVVALADGPKVQERPKDPFTEAEMKAIRKQMEGDRLLPLFFVALALGLREGEAFGLTWANVDLERGLLHVKQQVQPTRGGGFEFADPKTATSKSTLELTENQVSMLKAHRKALAKERLAAGSDWEDYDLVFPSTRGTPLSASNVRRNFNMILDSAGVRRRRLHDWRVTAASWLADLNAHPDTAKQVTRHRKHSTLLEYYTHAGSEGRRDAIVKLDARFNP